ncbi:hypothetical protein [Bradyrhizobium sp. URHC0002]
MGKITPEQVLSQYPGPVKLYRTIGQTVVTPAILGLFCGSLYFLDLGADYRPIAIGMGGFFLLFALVNYYSRSWIELNGWGFTTRDYGGAQIKCNWRETSEFSMDVSQWGVSVRYINPAEEPGVWDSRWRYVAVWPFDPKTTADLMNAWRDRALGLY